MVHFWNGATGVNLKKLADATFPAYYLGQLPRAQSEFPGVKYNQTEVDFANVPIVTAGTSTTKKPNATDDSSGSAVQLNSLEQGSFSGRSGLIAWAVLTTVALVVLVGGILFVMIRKRRLSRSSGNRILLREDDLSAGM